MRLRSGLPAALASDLATFHVQVRDALIHLYDLPFQPHHPLATLLLDPDVRGAGAALRDLLVRSIEELRPEASLPPGAPAWRRYHSLYLRYVAHESARHAAGSLAVSERHARREHHEALEALAALLWARRPVLHGTGALPMHNAEGGVYPAELTDVAATMHGVHETLVPLLAERDVTLEVTAPPHLSRASVGRVALRQALLAVVVEGVDLGRRTIAIDASEEIDTIRLHVHLEGEPAGRLASAPFVARRLIESCGGSLRVRPGGDGEDIDIALPRRRFTVLLVDDDPDFVRLFRRCLAGTPYTLLATWRADDLPAQVRAALPDVIVLDVLMPSRDGWELLQQLKSDACTRATPIVICSVLREESLARALGAADSLSKPVSQRELLAALERYRGAHAPPTDRATPEDNAGRLPSADLPVV